MSSSNSIPLTQPPRPAAAINIAGRLFNLADWVRRLPPPSAARQSRHRDPDAFHIAKSDIAAELRRMASDVDRSPCL